METEKFSGGSCSQERGSALVAMWKGHVQSREVSDNAAGHPLYACTTTHNDATTHTNHSFFQNLTSSVMLSKDFLP